MGNSVTFKRLNFIYGYNKSNHHHRTPRSFPKTWYISYWKLIPLGFKVIILRTGLGSWDWWVSSPRQTKQKFPYCASLFSTTIMINISEQLSRCRKCLKQIPSCCQSPLLSPPCISHLPRYKTNPSLPPISLMRRGGGRGSNFTEERVRMKATLKYVAPKSTYFTPNSN